MYKKLLNSNKYGLSLVFNILSIFILILAVDSCNMEKNIKENIQDLPQVILTNGKPVDPSIIHSPDTIPAGAPLVSTLPKLEWKELDNSKVVAKTPVTIKINNPDTITISKLPFNTGPISPQSILCASPEIVQVKNPFIPEKNPFNFSFLSVLQGLRHNQIRAMEQDVRGNLWLATDDGLTRYDGKNFYHYSLEQGLNNNLILSVMEDSKQNIWFGSFRGGVTRFNGVYLDIFTSDNGLPDDVVNHISEDDNGNIWFATGNGVAVYDGTTFTIYTSKEGLAGNDTRYILHDSKGYTWIATYGHGLSKFDGEKFVNFDETSGLPEKYLTSLLEDNTGRIWIGTTNRGVVVYDNDSFLHFTEEQGLHDNTIRYIYQDNEHNIWFASSANGLSYFDGKYFNHFGREEGLSSDYNKMVLQHQDGTIWIGTRGAGLCKFGGGQFHHFSNGVGLSTSRVMSINQDYKNRIWFGTFGSYITIMSQEGTSENTNTSFANLTYIQGIEGSRIYSILADSSGTIWLGSDGRGISKLSGNKSYNYTYGKGLAFNAVRDLVKDDKGRLWIATYGGGLSVFDGQSFINFDTSSGLPTLNLLTLHHDQKGNIWIGTDGGGLVKYSQGIFTYFNHESGFPAEIIYSMAEDRSGTMWFGTGGAGLAMYDGDKFTMFDTKTGLNNNYVMSLAFDQKDNLWLGTREGINILHSSQINMLVDSLFNPVFTGYGYEEGFTGISCNMGAIHLDSNGYMWIGSSDRLTRASTELSEKRSAKPILQITDFKINHSTVPWSSLYYSKDTSLVLANGIVLENFGFSGISPWNGLPKDLELSHKNNYVTFQYSTISHQHNNRIKYQYFLEGLENQWNTPTTRTEITYGNLPPGKYTFKVKALNNDGVWSKEEHFPFEISPPWYNTKGFFTIAILSLMLMVYLYIQQREKSLKKEKRILEQMVAEKTHELLENNKELEQNNLEKDKFFSIIAHDLKGPFNGFLGLSQIMAEDVESLSKHEIKDIAETMRDSASNLYTLLENLLLWSRMKNSTITFVPEKSDLMELVHESMVTLKTAAENKQIDVVYDITSNIVISADKNMFMTIMRNLLSNAIKFTSPGGRVIISCYPDKVGSVVVSVSDNGIGMSQDVIDNLFSMNKVSKRNGTAGEPSSGLGLVLCKEFVELHGGRLWVESGLDKGSAFYFSLPTK